MDEVSTEAYHQTVEREPMHSTRRAEEIPSCRDVTLFTDRQMRIIGTILLALIITLILIVFVPCTNCK